MTGTTHLRYLTTLLLILALLAGCSSDSDDGLSGDNGDNGGNGNDPVSETSAIRVDCPVNIPVPAQDTLVGVDFYLTSDIEISGFSVGFHYDSDVIDFTSVTPGPAIPAGTNLLQTFKPEENLVLIGWVDFSFNTPLQPIEDQKAFTLYLDIPAGVAPTVIDIDSAFVPPAGGFIFSPPEGGSVTPGYVDCGNSDVIISGK